MNVDKIKAVVESMPNLSTALGMEFISTDDEDTCMARMRVDERNRQPFGFLSGGASLALAENVAGVGSSALCPGCACVGIEVSGSHVKAVCEGDTVTMRDLVCGMLLPSGNDAANAAAVRVAGSVDAFVELMNRRAAEMGLCGTHFVTPSGLDDYTDDHYSTARDMAKLAAEAMKNQNFRDICSLQKAKVFFGDPPYDRWLINSNKLLKISGITGIKTGFTDKARRCLVSSCMREGCELICVTLNDPDDWRDHMALFDHCFGKVEQMRIRPRNSAVKVPGADGSEIVCEIPDMVMTMMPETAQKVESRLFLPHFVYRPIKKDEKLGEVVYYLSRRVIARRGLAPAACTHKAVQIQAQFPESVQVLRPH